MARVGAPPVVSPPRRLQGSDSESFQKHRAIVIDAASRRPVGRCRGMADAANLAAQAGFSLVSRRLRRGVLQPLFWLFALPRRPPSLQVQSGHIFPIFPAPEPSTRPHRPSGENCGRPRVRTALSLRLRPLSQGTQRLPPSRRLRAPPPRDARIGYCAPLRQHPLPIRESEGDAARPTSPLTRHRHRGLLCEIGPGAACGSPAQLPFFHEYYTPEARVCTKSRLVAVFEVTKYQLVNPWCWPVRNLTFYKMLIFHFCILPVAT